MIVGVMKGIQIGMFRTIQLDHTNCLQVAIQIIIYKLILRVLSDTSSIHRVAPGTGTPKDNDEVNR
jgi:hypothetical protein